ncbi:MAG: aminotransferase class III-fold pyridoxal phosphate-dependent enzyme [Spirochaetales bacterium]|nr:aminotransferase class III-fold pyridoxal phosphate-dependent enzyme [Spirochaetales bacterium]MCF7938947.1 aminotransferase class III-fold pyridoxal phosphate-dependent enzyme [Spirochaetales bacterium]
MVNREKLKFQFQKEQSFFENNNPKSGDLFRRAQQSLLQGVPMNWMVKWAGSYPLSVVQAKGAHFTDADGHEIIDFCLGDTGSMTGHAPEAAVRAITEQAQKGVTFMLPTEDAVYVGNELQERFALPFWQFATSATDANRFSLRIARMVTGRSKILIYNHSYHGSVDETVATLQKDGSVGPRPGAVGPPVDPALTTKVIEWNDIEALEAALRDGDVAAVLAEPVMTNIGIVHPEPGYHQALRELTQKYGTVLIIDETHTICSGPGGYTAEHNLQPDMLTIGKTIAGGIPAAAFGMNAELARKAAASIDLENCDVGGIGGTLAGNALTIAAMRATLTHVLTREFYDRAIPLAERFHQGVIDGIQELALPWNATRLGCRTEYWFRQEPAQNGGQAAAAGDFELENYMHLATLNRGILMTPFHNMALITAATTKEDVDRHTEVFREIAEAIID